MRVEGPLAGLATGFRGRLAERGYRLATVEDHVWLMGHVSQWLQAQEISPGDLRAAEVERFRLEHRLRYSHPTGPRALRPLIDYLTALSVLSEPVSAETYVDVLLRDYRDYLSRKRGLVPGSVRLRERVARLFLSST
jgi:hypothetical protein